MTNKQNPAISLAEAGGRDIRSGGRSIILDPYRAIVFPNAMRELRRRAGFPKLLGLAAAIPDIPYIRLSKIERGEVVAKAAELVTIAEALGVSPKELIVDIDDPAFSMAAWAAEIQDVRPADREAEEFAVMLGAALRLRRTSDRALSIAVIDKEYGIPPVILSRIENAHKTLDRWNDPTVKAICRVFGAADVEALKAMVHEFHRGGRLADLVKDISNPEVRIGKTRAKVAELMAQLSGPPSADGSEPTDASTTDAGFATANVRLLPVFGAPLPDGLIARTPTAETIEAPRGAGSRAYGLRVLRPTLGGGLPGRATVVVDPDRFPSSGLAVVKDGEGYRILSITFDRNGAMKGYSVNPDREIAIDTLDPGDVAAVLSAVFE